MVPDTLLGVPEMMDTPPILNSYVLYPIICRMDSHPVFYWIAVAQNR